MPVLAIAVAVTSALAILAGMSPFAAGPLALAATGLILAYAVWKSGTVSHFLRVFIVLFASEYVVTGLAYLLALKGFWPASWAALKIPMELPLTVGLFGILSFAVSFIPVVRTITRQADPYFAPENVRTARIPLIGQFKERTIAWTLVMTLIIINQLQVGISLRISFWQRDLFNSLQTGDQPTFWNLIVVVFPIWATLFVVMNLIELFLDSVLKIRWREHLVGRLTGNWLDNGRHYRMGFLEGTDNPDQRITEDVRSYVELTYAYSLSLISTLSNLVSFSIILWSVPAQFTIPFTSIVVPGLPFWSALIYSILGTWLTHKIGRPLIGLDFHQEKREADFRYSLARLREYPEQIALLKGEPAEKQLVGSRFMAVVSNYYAILKQKMKLNTFVWYYYNASTVVPYILMAPAVFSGQVKIGEFMQVVGAFNRVEGSMQWFIARYQSLAAYKAVIDRLDSFDTAVSQSNEMTAKSAVARTTHAGQHLTIPALDLAIPNGQTIATVRDLTMKKGQSLLVTGPSGSGKSTLFRAISGIWPFGKGDIQIPDGATIMLLPQRPYLPLGTLRDVTLYPALAGAHSDEAINKALETARLPKLVGKLDEKQIWSQVLSLGEQQRLAIARALLSKPDWLFLDEATAALDETTEAAVYELIKRELPGTTIVSIGHRSTLIAMHDRRIDLKAGADGLFLITETMPEKPKVSQTKTAKAVKPLKPRMA
jgi:vitamin B12/bleomycin/antimicrobial peptide transport system ATP-binding/permease protein